VLFLDELPEFDHRALEVLRQPLESGAITIARAARHAEFPARFQLIAAMNPCPCGYLGHPSGKCHCSPDRILRYQSRLSGPLLDRFDMHIEVEAMLPDHIAAAEDGEPSHAIAARVAQARERQLARQGKPNHQLSVREVDRYCKPNGLGEFTLRDAMAHLDWSARTYHRVLRMARTVADLADCERVDEQHVSEAIFFRRGLYRKPRH
jgi:magnesium chelatase family protein